MGVALIDLTDEELAARRPAMVAEFAASMTDNFGIPPERARVDAERQMQAILPDGVATKGELLRKAVDGDAEVGFLWISLPGTSFPEMAWISEITVAADQRSRGYGSQMIAAAEADLVGRGVHTIGLHVFGRNTGARRLYDRLGYRIFFQVRALPVAGAPTGGTPVDLVPMSGDDFESRVAGLIADHPLVLTHDPAAGAEVARNRVQRIAPYGPRTEGVFACTAWADGRPAGWIWFGLPTAERPALGLVTYLEVDPAQRRRGIGRGMLGAAAAELSRHGVTQMGVNVPGEPLSLAFADALDLPVVSQQMIKDLA
jgi:mycothiol synthase